MDDNINEQERLRASLDLTIQKTNELKESFQQGAGIQSAIDMAGQLGWAIAAVITSINDLKNIWSFIKVLMHMKVLKN